MNLDHLKRIERINKMEQHLDTAQNAIRELNVSISNFLLVQSHIQELEQYYKSQEWLDDYDADCNGELPQELKRGALSQDAIYNLLCENDNILKTIQNITTEQQNNYGKNKD